MAIFLTESSKVIVQGMTGSEGSKHTRRMLASGTTIVGALKMLGDEATKPLVVRLDGNNVDEGRRILNEADHPLVIQAETMDAGADKAAELAFAALNNAGV